MSKMRSLIAFEASGLNVTLVLVVATAVGMLMPPSPFGQTLCLVTLVLVPGSFFASRRAEFTSVGFRLLAVATFGLVFFFLVSFLLGAVPPIVGFNQPLNRDPSIVVWLAILVAMGAVDLRRGRDAVRSTLTGINGRTYVWTALCTFAPATALVGVTRLNLVGQTTVAWVASIMVVALAVVACVVAGTRRGPHPVVLLGAATVTAAIQMASRGGWFMSWDINHEFSVATATISAGRFPIPGNLDPYAGMLSITTLPAQLFSLSGLGVHAFLTTAPALALAGAVAAMWLALTRLVSERVATLLVSTVVLGSFTFVRSLPGITRQCWAIFFFAVLLCFLVDAVHSRVRQSAVLAAAGIAMAMSHYSTAYLAVGAVIFGYLANVVLRVPTARRVLTAPLTAFIAIFTVGWENLIAHTGANLSQLQSAITDSGFNFLPGSGSFVTRWLKGASIGQVIPAAQMRLQDLALRSTTLKWMVVDPRAVHTVLVDRRAPSTHGAPILGGLALLGNVIVSEGTLLLFLISVVIVGFDAIKHKRHVEWFGLAMFAVIASGLSRLSQTIAVQFGPDRVAIQMFMIFLIVLAIVLPRLRRFVRRVVPKADLVLKIFAIPVVVFAIASGLQLTNYLGSNQVVPAPVGAIGEQVQRAVAPGDVNAAAWTASRIGNRFLQADLFGQLSLFNFGFANRHGFLPSVDPVIVFNPAWVLTSQTNNLATTARGGTNAAFAVFTFPRAYFGHTRNIIFVSNANVVYGADVIFSLQ